MKKIAIGLTVGLLIASAITISQVSWFETPDLAIDTTQTTYNVSEDAIEVKYQMEHIYQFDTAFLNKELSYILERILRLQGEKQDMIDNYNRELVTLNNQRKRVQFMINKINE